MMNPTRRPQVVGRRRSSPAERFTASTRSASGPRWRAMSPVPQPISRTRRGTIGYQFAEKLNRNTRVWWPIRIRAEHVGILQPSYVMAVVELGPRPHAGFREVPEMRDFGRPPKPPPPQARTG